jgi:hypothetical protein
MVQLIVTGTNTTVFEVNVDQGSSPTWVAMNVSNVNTGVTVASATASGIFRCDVSGAREFRVRCSAYTNGSVVVSMNGSVATARPATTTSGGVVDTELPAAAALADAAANPTAPAVGSFGMTWNGATWDRMLGDTAGRVSNAPRGSATTLSDSLSNAPSVPIAANGTVITSPVVQYGFNGTTWDRERHNVEATYLASAARTATPTVADVTTYNAGGITVVINVTAVTATPSVVFTIDGKDALSGVYYNLLTSAAVTGVSTVVLRVSPGITVAANLAAAQLLPRVIRILPTHGDADSITYTVAYVLHC